MIGDIRTLAVSALMSDTDVEQVAYGLLQDARILGCAAPEQLINTLEWLVEAQAEIARALEKAGK